jgi:hypothetical protein
MLPAAALDGLAGVAVAHRRLGPSSSATTSTTDRTLPSSAVQLRCWRRPTTTTRLPLLSDSAACSAWSRHTITVKNDASCSRRPETATRNITRAIPASVCRSSGWSVRLPAKVVVMELDAVEAVCGGQCPRDGRCRQVPADLGVVRVRRCRVGGRPTGPPPAEPGCSRRPASPPPELTGRPGACSGSGW